MTPREVDVFDDVGVELDEDRRWREARATLLLALTTCGLAGVAVGIGALRVQETLVDAPLEEPWEVEEIVFLDPEPELGEAPPPPPPARQAAGSETPDEEPEPTSEEPPDDPQELTEPPEPEVASTGGSADGDPDGEVGGDVDGQVGGDPDGEIGGVLGGTPGGDGDTIGGTGPRVLHHTQLSVRSRVDPEFPHSAKGLGLGEVDCRATIDIDARGRVTRVQVTGCPAPFVARTEEALYRWRFWPPKVAGERSEAQTRLLVRFREI